MTHTKMAPPQFIESYATNPHPNMVTNLNESSRLPKRNMSQFSNDPVTTANAIVSPHQASGSYHDSRDQNLLIQSQPYEVKKDLKQNSQSRGEIASRISTNEVNNWELGKQQSQGRMDSIHQGGFSVYEPSMSLAKQKVNVIVQDPVPNKGVQISQMP